jgi:hypothetical protein
MIDVEKERLKHLRKTNKRKQTYNTIAKLLMVDYTSNKREKTK